MKTLLLVLFAMLTWLALSVPSATAHEMTITDLNLRELEPGKFLWSWGIPGRNLPVADELTAHWPQGCQAQGQMLDCGAQGLQGTLSVDGVGVAYSALIVRIHALSGNTQVHTLTASQPQLHLFGAGGDQRGTLRVAQTYAVLGVQHILSGFDHLLFVLGLLFLVGFRRRLVGTITAFTAAHSLTLACSALGLLVLRSPPVEASIALSIALVSAEALCSRDTLTRRFPAVVAFLFGLVHGLGFAGALKEIGLPAGHVPVALVTFNLGVEAGQLLVVGSVYVLWRLLRVYAPALQRWRAPALYAMGTLASYWSILRLIAIVQ